MSKPAGTIEVRGAAEHNLKSVDVSIDRGAITVITGVSGSGKSSLAFDTVLAEAQRRFFYTLSHYSRQFLDLAARPAVRTLAGLSPAISLAQNETPPSRRATVGTLTDLSELVGVLLARFGEQRCPTHDQPTGALTADAIVDLLMAKHAGATVAITAPIVEAKKGIFKKELSGFTARGYLRAWIDGELVPLTPMPVLAREEKHTIKLLIDSLKVKPEARARLLRSVETAIQEGQGYGQYFPMSGLTLDLAHGATFSTAGGCPVCGYSWPRLDSRHFSANSLGRCEACLGLGFDASGLGEEGEGGEAEEDLAVRERTGLTAVCAACGGTGLAATLGAIRLAGRTPHELHMLPLVELVQALDELLQSPSGANAALRRVGEEALASARRIVQVGLGYLTLARRIRSLSGGEAQRLKLAGILAENLRGVLYILDEPSQGLHPDEIDRLVEALRRLKANGNTVIAVDHDEALMRQADWIIDLGPGGGARGGRVMAKFQPGEATRFVRESVTARHLARGGEPLTPSAGRALLTGEEIVIEGAHLHNLQVEKARFPVGALTVVTGVSGAGKSSLVLSTLYPNAAAQAALNSKSGRGGPERMSNASQPRSSGKARGASQARSSGKTRSDTTAAGSEKGTPRHCARVSGLEGIQTASLVDRRPIAKSSVSMPATYLDIFGELRDLYASMPDAQIMGLTARSFSLSVEGGRCPECKGKGQLSLSMRFLADARVKCPVCQGRRYQSNALGVKYLGLGLDEVLELTLDEVLEHFKTHKKIVARLAPAVELGLGYLKLGQPSASLSGGEAQRLKLVPHLTRRHGQGSLIILDEPTTGLHFEDVRRLLAVVRRLVAEGATVVTIEHNADVIQAADWRINLGPGAARDGGRILYQGVP